MPKEAQTDTTKVRVRQTPNRQNSQQDRRQFRDNTNRVRGYSPPRMADTATSGVGLLEAEYFGILFLLVVELFAGTASYGDKMISMMKRGTLVTILFFVLALIAGTGPNAAKVTKGIGGLVLVGILLSSPGNSIITALDNFTKSDWVAGSNNATASADTGTQQSTGGAIATAEGAAASSANTITEINLPGIGPVFAVGTIVDGLKKLFHL
jgi:hypothetical protein